MSLIRTQPIFIGLGDGHPSRPGSRLRSQVHEKTYNRLGQLFPVRFEVRPAVPFLFVEAGSHHPDLANSVALAAHKAPKLARWDDPCGRDPVRFLVVKNADQRQIWSSIEGALLNVHPEATATHPTGVGEPALDLDGKSRGLTSEAEYEIHSFVVVHGSAYVKCPSTGKNAMRRDELLYRPAFPGGNRDFWHDARDVNLGRFQRVPGVVRSAVV